MMSIELKREIIEKHEQGVRVVDLSRQYGRSTSMICSVLKRKESIKSVTPAKGLTIISKLRTSLHENMEKLLMVWVTEKQLQGDTLTQTIICEKARAIYGDLLKQTPQTSIDEASEESFKASRGWFENFKKRSGIHSVVRHVHMVQVMIIMMGRSRTLLLLNPTRQKSWGLLGQFPKQTPRPNCFGKKAMLCRWWDQTGVVYFELLKPGKMVNTSRYEQQMQSLREALNEKRPEWREKHNNLILQHDNAPAHNATVVKNTIKDLGWKL
ncbi:hypothetical protein LAZ67_2000601 [Cordylochernes scorpioides]|uniref:HTH CENPB-type domain-containing protein n=1 Tax=Cordylochernes scorpioides TaxID=51811 RepID=A0ABY6K0J5_9ARAC|nr:hypothetical protein LAZ67_2000601 [Cordylochernes scorpioides]